MFTSPWLIISLLQIYKWLFYLFFCQCSPGGGVTLAHRLSYRTRILDDHFVPRTIETHRFDSSGNDYNKNDNSAIYRSIDKRFDQESSNNHVHLESNSHVQQSTSGNNFRKLLKQISRKSISDNQLSSNGICSTPDDRFGHCYEASECIERGGIPMGRCQASSTDNRQESGSSVCCLFEVSCGDSISEKHVYFRNPGYPSPLNDQQLCRLKVNKFVKDSNGSPQSSSSSSSICQLKLNMIEFDIAKPIEGNCTQDIFSVSGQNENNIIPRICGYNSGQHYYIAVDESGLINLQMVFRGKYSRKFEIHIEQLECGSKDLAPPYCLQYFDSNQGTIQSFNYDLKRNGGPEGRSEVTDGYPNNIDYLICIRKETGFCSISYEFMSDSNGAVLPFSVGTSHSNHLYNGNRESQSRGASALNIPKILALSEECDDDYLIVGGFRVCSRVKHATNNDAEHDMIGILSTLSTTSIEPSGNNGNDITTPESKRTNGELHEIDESIQPVFEPPSTPQQSVELRRPHRRANYHHQFYYGDSRPSSLNPDNYTFSSRSRGIIGSIRRQGNLMATDSTPGPFQLRFVANEMNNARGFYLFYRQNPCKI
ncbi:hypothetical protein BLOT_011514 [Blomia tropicalis]|nr:hypothetical protein BLOT_011514 [Blomia tropicalis]